MDRLDKILIGTFMVLLIIFGGLLGFGLSTYYNFKYKSDDCSTQAKINGLWLPDIKALSQYEGEYICINIENVDTLSQLKNTCEHEVGHEIFARECESNFTKCLEVVG